MVWRSLGFWCAAAWVLLSGCASSSHFRTTVTPCQTRSYAYAPGLPGCKDLAYTFNLIEFNENGRLWDAGQLASAEGAITHLAAQKKPLLLVIFIHGWHHNADVKDENIASLESVLARTTRSLPDWNIMGIYLGWRGESTALKPEFLNNISFYNRRSAADRVANSVELADTLLRLGFDAKNAYMNAFPGSATEAPPPQPQVILVGHSFGGRILERSIVPSLLASVRSEGEINRGKPFDLILLMNPAHSALGTMDLVDTLRDATYDQRPFIVNITSTADSATGTIYPLAQRLNGNHGPYATFSGDDLSLKDERYLSTYTAGHLAQFQSHIAVPLPAGKNPDDYPFHFIGDGKDYVIEEQPAPQPWNWARGAAAVAGSANPAPTPYWVIRVEKDLVANHGDIFNDKVEAMISVLLERTMAGETSAKAYSQRTVPSVAAPPPASAGRVPQNVAPVSVAASLAKSVAQQSAPKAESQSAPKAAPQAAPKAAPRAKDAVAAPAAPPQGGSMPPVPAAAAPPQQNAAPPGAMPPPPPPAPRPASPASPASPGAPPVPRAAVPPPPMAALRLLAPPPPGRAAAAAVTAAHAHDLTAFGINATAEKDMAPYERFELYGFRALLVSNEAEAIRDFDLSYERRQDFHSVAAIRRILRGRGTSDEKLKEIASHNLQDVNPAAARLVRQAAGLE
jgi:hypothetical protein